MPWCPKCKVEYVEGITTCSDCNTPLVDQLPKKEDQEDDLLEHIKQEDNQEKPEIDDPNFRPGVFVESSKKREEYESSFQALVLVGIISAILSILVATNKIPFVFTSNQRLLYSIVLGVMTIVFMVIGLSSRKRAKELVGEALEEEALEEEILDHFKTNYITPEDGDGLDESQLFFYRNEAILAELALCYPDLTSTYIDHISEEIYESLYEA